MIRMRLALLFAIVLFASLPAIAQAPVCDVTCSPNPSSPSYGGAVAARPKLLNARGAASLFQIGAGPKGVSTIVGSQSYNYAIPILSLPGRAGLNLNLNLYYNSRIWDIDTVSHTATFNADRDFPSYGFRLDYGYLEYDTNGSQFILTDQDGTKHALVDDGTGTTFNSTDGTFIKIAWSTKAITYRNGNTTQYEAFPSNGNLFRPIKVKDVNGNFISVSYLAGHDQFIHSITDTLGRIINFHYDSNNQLSYIDQNVAVSAVDPTGVHRYVTFTWAPTGIYGGNYAWYSFSGLTANGAPAFTSALSVITGCTYANNTGYRFTYGDWGIINKIENLSSSTPTPAVRSYVAYNYPPVSAGAITDAPAYTAQTISPDGTSTSVWNYTATKSGVGIVTSMQVSDPLVQLGDPSGSIAITNVDSTGMLTSVQLKDASGKLLKTVSYVWATSGGISVPGTITTTLNDTGQQSSIQYSGYDSYGNPGTITEKDFNGQTLRQTVTSYAAGAYTTQHILGLPTQILIKDGSGNIIARTDIGYDQYSTNPMTSIAGASNHDDVSYGVGFTTRGNITSTTRYSNASAGTGVVSRNLLYDSLGNLITAQLDCCNQQTFNFSAASQYAYPASIVRGPAGLQFTTSTTYNVDKGLVLSTTDENGQITQYGYDLMNRPISTSLPPQGSTNVQYTTVYDDNGAFPTVTKFATPSSITAPTIVTTADGLGHILQLDTQNGSTVVSRVTSLYDQDFRVKQSSNPFAPATEMPLYTGYSYDPLGRPKKITPPSSGYTQYDYAGNTVTVTDPAGKQRKTYNDALGRMVQVDEPGTVSDHIPANNHVTMQTDGNFVLYDPFGNPIWSTGTPGLNAGPILLQDDGNLVLYVFKWQAGVYAAPSPGPFPAQVCNVGRALNAPQVLSPGQCLVSPSGQYRLGMETDGNLVLYNMVNNVYTVTWNSATYGHPGAYASFQADGNFVVYTSTGVALWSSGTAGTDSQRLDMEDDGRFIIYKSAWNSGTSTGQFNWTQLSHPACDVGAGAGWTGGLGTGQCLVSPNGHFELLLQTDGNMVINDLGATPAITLWSTNTALTPLSLDVAFHTTYTYNPLGNLTNVSQAAITGTSGSGQPRAYSYDSLGRLISTTTPESGTVTTAYTTSSGGTCAGDPGLPCRVQDARGIIKTITYDGLNRLTGVAYSDGTAPVIYQYDAGGAPAFALNRLTSILEGSANSKTFTYDNLGHITAASQIIDSTTYSIQYAYNLANQLTSITYPSGRIVTQSYDAIGRLCAVGMSGSTCSSGTAYLNNVSYNSAGEALEISMGNGVQGAFTYNDHMQISALRFFKGSSEMLNLAYDYTTGSPGNNGQIQGVHYYTSPGTEDLTKSENFSYDASGRLSAAHTALVDSTPGTWSLQWTYDRFGNRTSQALVGGNVVIGQPNFGVDPSTNRIASSGYTYDAAGNMTHDATASYTYDGAGRMTKINSGPPTYTYFGSMRIKKVVGSTTTTYIYSGSKPIAEYSGTGTLALSKEYIYAGAQLLVTIAGSTVTYHHPDHLSNRAESDSSGNMVRTAGYFPFGEVWYESGSLDKWKFTSYERDSDPGETGLDYAQFRYMSSGQGRFLSPDQLGGNRYMPQSLNRYAYVANDPINLIDPTGRELRGNLMCLLDSQGNCAGSGDCPTIDGMLDVGCMAGSAFGDAGVFAPCNDNQCIFNDDGLTHFDNLVAMSYFTTNNCFLSHWDGQLWCGSGDNLSLFSSGQTVPSFKPWDMRGRVLAILRATNDCSKFFNKGTGGSATKIMSNVDVLYYTSKDTSYFSLPPEDATTTESPTTPIEVNTKGRFYAGADNGLLLGDVYPAGSPGAQLTILLHELAHKVQPPGFVNDAFSPADSDKNTGLIVQHCEKAIDDNVRK